MLFSTFTALSAELFLWTVSSSTGEIHRSICGLGSAPALVYKGPKGQKYAWGVFLNQWWLMVTFCSEGPESSWVCVCVCIGARIQCVPLCEMEEAQMEIWKHYSSLASHCTSKCFASTVFLPCSLHLSIKTNGSTCQAIQEEATKMSTGAARIQEETVPLILFASLRSIDRGNNYFHRSHFLSISCIIESQRAHAPLHL